MDRLKTESITSLFFKYLLPSVTGTLSVGILIFIDTIFIGQGVGSHGLAALNTAIPVFTLYSSTGLLLGMGGATAAAVDAGRGNNKGKNKIFSHAVLLAVVISIVYTLAQFIFIDGLVSLLGATGDLYELVKDYLGMISLFTMFYLVPHTLTSFIRNDGNPNLAMVSMVVCGIVNIILDYTFIFIFDMGMKGAALATGIAQVTSLIVLMIHFYSPKNTLKLRFKSFNILVVNRIFKIGFPSFLNDISMGVAIFSFNIILLKNYGDVAVSAYSVILNIGFLVYLIFVGISQACQPLISINYGAMKYDRVKETLKLGGLLTTVVALVTITILHLFKVPIIEMFNKDDMELKKIAAVGMPLYFSSIVFMGINVIYSIFFQSVERSLISSTLTFLRGLGLIVTGLLILPKFMGISGVWLTPLFAETITIVIAFTFYMKFYWPRNRDDIT